MRKTTAFADPELSQLFDGEPELLAIADAITATAADGTKRRVSPPSSRRGLAQRTRLPVAAALLAAAIATAPALALSATVRELVGLTKRPSNAVFVARVTDVVVHGPQRPGTPVTITFTVGEQGKPPGAGIPPRSTFFVALIGKTQFDGAQGAHGHYRATARLGPGGLRGIQIGGFMPSKGPKVLNGGIWIPTIVDIPH